MCVWSSAAFGWFGTSWVQFISKPDASQSFNLFFCSMFALVGFYMLIGRFIHNYWQCKARYYIVTDKRVVAYSGFWPSTINSISLNELGNVWIWRESKNANRGSMAFGDVSVKDKQVLAAGITRSLYNPTSGVVFNDLDDIQSALSAVKSACRGRDLQVEESKMIEWFSPVSVQDRKEAQEYYKDVMTELKNLKEAASKPEPTTLLSKEDKERLIQQHRRIYICRSVGLLFGAATSFLFGMTQLATYERDFKSATESKNWPSVRGTISDIQVITSKGKPYLHSFRVNFQAEGKPYKCETYSLRMGNEADEKDQLQFGTEHKVGDTVDVFYDPKDPDISFLDRSSDLPAIKGRKECGIGGQIIAALFLVVALFRLMVAGNGTFEPKPLKDYGLGGTLYISAFLSVWFAMLFNFLLMALFCGVGH